MTKLAEPCVLTTAEVFCQSGLTSSDMKQRCSPGSNLNGPKVHWEHIVLGSLYLHGVCTVQVLEDHGQREHADDAYDASCNHPPHTSR